MAKKLWASFNKKYKIKNVGTKKFVVGRFLKYKMVNSKTVISQVQEFQLILHEIKAVYSFIPTTNKLWVSLDKK